MPTQEQQEIAQLKGRLSRLEARLEFLYRHLDVTFVEDTGLSDDPKVIAALKANNITEAIKLRRPSRAPRRRLPRACATPRRRVSAFWTPRKPSSPAWAWAVRASTRSQRARRRTNG